MANFFESDLTRRKFVSGSLLTLGALPMVGFRLDDQNAITVQQLIDLILKEIPGNVPNTVDTIKIGDPSQRITSVVATMFPTIEVIRKAIQLKANFIIVHEPSFYNHADETSWLAGDEVFEFKKSLLEKK
jgi:hypothetical protein